MDSRFRLVRTDKFAVVAQGGAGVISSFRCTDARGQVVRFELLSVEGYSWGAELRGLSLSDQPHWGAEIEDVVRTAFWHHSMLVFGASSLYACDCPGLSCGSLPPNNDVDALCELLEKTLHTTAAYEAFARLCSGDEWKIEDVASYHTLYSLTRHQRLEQLLGGAVEHMRRAAGGDGNGDSRPCSPSSVDSSVDVAWSLLQRVVQLILDSGTTGMKHGNTRCQVLKHMGYVLPTDALVGWVAQCFDRSQCTRIISVGSGCALFELALCLWFVRDRRQAQHPGRVKGLRVICVDDDSEQLGAGVAGAASTPFALSGQAARVAALWGIEMEHTAVLPSLARGDGLLISWGRPQGWAPTEGSSGGGGASGEGPLHACDNVWERAASAAARTAGVDVAVVVGEAGETAQTWRCDTWQGCQWRHRRATGNERSAQAWKATESSEHDVNVSRFHHFATDFAVEWSKCHPHSSDSYNRAQKTSGSGVRFIVAPGNGGCAAHTQDANWYGWLDGELKKRGHESVVVNWPDPYICHQRNWIPFARDELKADEHTVVVGHSTGALLAMRLLEIHKIRGAILVSAAHTDLGDPGERASGYFDEPWDFEAMKPNAAFIHQFHSADDHLIPVAEARFVAEHLAGENFTYEELDGHSHFFGPFQPLLDCIDKYCPPVSASSEATGREPSPVVFLDVD